MITRIWHGKTKPENEELYLKFLLQEGTDEYRQTEGNLSAKVWRKRDESSCHFWTVTEWDNLDSVKAFAGDDFEKAKYYPADDGMLVEFEEHVNHYEGYDVSNIRIKNFIRQLERTHHGKNWLDENFAEKLKSVTEAEAFEAPVPGVHSVAEILWHCIYWRTVLIQHLRGNTTYRDETVDQFNFLPMEELRKKGWAGMQREMDETQSSLIQLMGEKTDRFLEREYKPGYTYEYIVEGIIQHDIYHLGQIGLVLKILTVTGKRNNVK
jgi:uncharacterized damage-inducible protein DinB/heme-degrading monooxygenase HmoA